MSDAIDRAKLVMGELVKAYETFDILFNLKLTELAKDLLSAENIEQSMQLELDTANREIEELNSEIDRLKGETDTGNIIWSDLFNEIPQHKFGKYILTSPNHSQSFRVDDGILEITYVANPEIHRSEMSLWGPNPDKIVPHRDPLYSERFYEFILKIPAGYNFSAPVASHKRVLAQWYQEQGLNPPLSLELVRDEFRLVRLWANELPTSNPNTREIIWASKAQADIWYKFTFNIRWDHKPQGETTGFIRLKLNDQSQSLIHADPYPNCYKSTLGLTPRLGNYRPGAKPQNGIAPVPAGTVDKLLVNSWKIWK